MASRDEFVFFNPIIIVIEVHGFSIQGQVSVLPWPTDENFTPRQLKTNLLFCHHFWESRDHLPFFINVDDLQIFRVVDELKRLLRKLVILIIWSGLDPTHGKFTLCSSNDHSRELANLFHFHVQKNHSISPSNEKKDERRPIFRMV